MPFNSQDTTTYRRDTRAGGKVLSTAEREALLKKYLPSPPQKSAKSKTTPTDRSRRHRPRIRPYLKSLIHLSIHLFLQLVFGVYIRLRQIANSILQKFLSIRHYHHRTPAYIKKDTDSLSRLPEHLSVLLRYDESTEDPAALETLIDEVAELAAWSTAAGIPLLSVYEKTGVLKIYMSAVQELIQQKLVQYFGAAPHTPTLKIHAPNLPTLLPVPAPVPSPDISAMNGASTGPLITTNGHDHRHHIDIHTQPPATVARPPHLNLLFLSATDGRDTLVDLTRTLTEMAQSSKLQPRDITTSLINTEINATTAFPTSSNPSTPFLLSRNASSTHLDQTTATATTTSTAKTTNGHHNHHHQADDQTSKPSSPSAEETRKAQQSLSRLEKTSQEALPSEPDLLIIFAPYVKLDGYPPWQIRLTEIYCVGDSGGDISGRFRRGHTRVEYQGFLRGLWKYAGAQMRFGS